MHYLGTKLVLLMFATGSACSLKAPSPPVKRNGQAKLPSSAVADSVPEIEVPAAISIQTQALDLLNKQCGICHSPGNAQGNFGTLSNVEEMIAGRRYIVPGSPEKSLLFTKLAPTGNMPPAGAMKPEEVDLISTWIKDLSAPVIAPLTETDMLRLVRTDLETNVPPGQRADVRYFSLHVPHNLGATSATLGSLRLALAKVLNSLSRSPAILIPKAIDKDKLLYRIQLNDLASNAQDFDQVMRRYYPFGQTFVAVPNNAPSQRAVEDHQFLSTQIASDIYLIRADWFIATATLPAPYAELLQLGADQAALEQQLGVNHIQNVIADRAVRAGFKNSNVSSQNRIIERHVQRNGLAYWLSYDFATNEELGNLFSAPLGPAGIGQDPARTFEHDGGEMIFQLPNGMFGYYLANNVGGKIDKGPTSIVKQVDAPQQFVSSIVNGVSCMSCHGAGLLYKADDVRPFAEANPGIFTPVQLNKIRTLYVEERRFKELFDRDNTLYFAALSALGINPALPDPVSQAFRYYNRALSRNDVREELGLNETEFTQLLTGEPFRSQWSSLNSNQGYIKRDELQVLIQEAIDVHKLSAQAINPTVGDALVTPQCMFDDPLLMSSCLVRTPALPLLPATNLVDRQ
jgi:mono/diheme cytochrome c family protein